VKNAVRFRSPALSSAVYARWTPAVAQDAAHTAAVAMAAKGNREAIS
jgi:hypothetical protein